MPTLPYPAWLTGLPHWKGADLDKHLHRINDARFRLHTEALRDLKGTAGNVVLWAPEAEPGEGYVVEWSDAVEQVNKMVGPTTIKIISSNPNTDVFIPEGTWQLNETTLVGIAWDASGDPNTDPDFRGWQNLIDVFGTGNRTLLKGCVGLKDMAFRASDYDGSLNGDSGTFTAKADNTTMTFTAGGGDTFTADDVGKPIRIGHVAPYTTYGSDTDETDNRGIFIITAVLGPTTIQFENVDGIVDDANNGDIGWSLCTSMFLSLNDGTKKKPFVLDNVDFRYNGDYDWGSFFVEANEDQFFVLKNGASVRWYAISVQGYIVVQSDGSPAWIGVDAFMGNGEVEMFPMAGTQVRPQYSIGTWTLHQPTTVYIPDNSSDWDGDVETIHDALDQLAARVRSLE